MLQVEAVVARRVFPSWSIEVPVGLIESMEPQGYWHARDEIRSVSLTSLVMTSRTGPPPTADELLAILPLEGTPLDELPEGLPGRCTVRTTDDEVFGRCQMFQGMVAVTGLLLIVTITGGDPAWARRTWLSIRHVKTNRRDRRQKEHRPKRLR
jgi:hypothetical protein